MINKLQTYQQNFVYIDSSEEQDDLTFQRNQQFNQLTNSNFSYNDSSFSEHQPNFYQSSSDYNKSKGKKEKNKKKLCKIKSDKFLLNDGYIKAVEKIIKENQQKLSKKTPLLIPHTDKQIIENLEKRNKNYGYFLRALQVDKHYNELLSKKVEKLKKQNERKKKILQNKKTRQILKEDEVQIKKFVLEKKTKQQIVIDKIQKHAYKLGIQRIRMQQKQLKNEVKQIDKLNDLKTINLDLKQRNQIYQLRQQLQKIREINKINKVEQKKVLKDLQKNVTHTKKELISKAETAQLKKFII